MNIFIPLIAGIVAGYVMRKAGRRFKIDLPVSASLLAMVFFLGVKTGEVHVSGLWLFGSSLLFAIFTIAGSLLLAGVGR
ncbi:hypothetical protein [Thermococcus sp.]|jgi:uncharacterized membrane protein YbjE (DUF340 family)|uniref:hypothetical protein n=1 Tax=Thermococcus sp. TaxID=35749 RepID=UPI00260855FB|nr:hypothetical protein [Thermococcus sp.]